jgi:hypothetical protein
VAAWLPLLGTSWKIATLKAMTDRNLSPQAQAVMDAFESTKFADHYAIAAAIRAAAEELQYRLFLPGDDPMVVSAKALFNLANELDSQ